MHRLLRELLFQVAVCAAYFAAFEAIALFHPSTAPFDLTALTIGVPLTACLRRGPSMAIGTFVAGTACLTSVHPFGAAVVLALSQSGCCALASWILRRSRFDVRLERPGEFATLLAIVIPLVSMADALVGALVMTSDADLPTIALSWIERTTSNLIGATLTTPAALLAIATRLHLRGAKRTFEFAALLAGLLLATLLVPVIREDGGLLWPVAVCIAMPFVILLVVRFARVGALTVAIVLGVALVCGIAIDRGKMIGLDIDQAHKLATIGLWVMTLVILAVAMLLGVTIAAHRKESAEVRSVASRLRHVVDAARLGYWQFDSQWRTQSVNARLAEMLGIDEDAIIGTRLLDVVTERGRNDVREQIAALERGASETLELECRRPDERVAWLGLQVTRYGGGGAAPAGRSLRSRISPSAEAERLKLESNMLHAQRFESLGVLAGGLAHDFNNIVMGIRGNAGLLRIDSGAGDTQACADRIEALCQRAADLVSTLLAYAGKGDFSMERLTVARVVREAIGTSRMTVPANATIAFECSEDSLEVHADPHHLRQLIVGIMTNALEALPPSGGTVRVRCQRVMVSTNGNGDGDAKPMAEIEFSDDGCGMGDATLARVFEPFFSTKGLGRSLGMSAALGIARRLGGTIHVDSRLGTGTTVLVRIPCATEHDVTNASGTRSALGRRPTAILAEPDASLRDLIIAALEIRGFAVVLERDFGSAVAAAEERPPGVIVAHAGQSVLDSLDMVRESRARGCEVPMVLTTDSRDRMVIDATDARTLWIPRPFDVRRLLDGIDEATGIRAIASV